MDIVALTLDMQTAASRICDLAPAVAFNLVESVAQRDALLPLGPMLLDTLRVRYTGNNHRALQSTTDKLLAKRLMRAAGVPTPDWGDGTSLDRLRRYVVKSATEHASLGLDARSVVIGTDTRAAIQERKGQFGGEWFAEEYIHGREFNLALLAGPDGPQLLPPAEIAFVGFAPEQPHIVGYAAKWDSTSGDYQATTRRTDFPPDDAKLIARLEEIARTCWALFELRGYARVDLRVDRDR